MTKILPTIGPISSSPIAIKQLINLSNFVRINGSHNTIDWHSRISKKVKKINKKAIILLDIPGVKPRILNEGKKIIKKNELCCFYYKKKPVIKNINKFFSLSNPIPSFNKSLYFSISDGSFNFKIIKSSYDYIIGKSDQNFELEEKKGLNIPNSIYSTKKQNQKYLKFLKQAKSIKFDAIGLSFVQDGKIVKKIKKIYPNKIIVSKIENSQGLKNCEEIVLSSDVIMIDRGDLGAEIGDTNLYSAIIKITQKANQYGKVIIMATENLQSMIKNPSPLKSELVSLEFSLVNKTDFIMLSEETATSKYFIRTIRWLSNFLKKKKNKVSKINKKLSIWESIKLLDTDTIILFTKKGHVVEKLRQKNKDSKLIIFSDNQHTLKISSLRSNTICIKTPIFSQLNLNKFIYENIKKNISQIFNKNKSALLIHVSFPRKNSRANTISFINKNDFF